MSTILRDACSIPDPDSDTLIVTGGEHTLSTVSRCGVVTRHVPRAAVHVSRYGRKYWIQNLAPLNVGRLRHGCGSYVASGQRVRWLP